MSASSLPRLEVRMLLEAVLNQPRTWLIAHDDELLTEQQVQVFYILVARRTAGVPMAYLLGTREFMGLTFCVSPHVLIPRPDTETLVNRAIEVIKLTTQPAQKAYRVLDLGTGSGAIAISIALACPDVMVDATDLSAQALATAELNATLLKANVRFVQGDWYQALQNLPNSFPGDGAAQNLEDHEAGINSMTSNYQKSPLHLPSNAAIYNLIVSNPPYIASQDPHLVEGDLRFEPPQALTDGADGLSALTVIITQAPQWLKPAGQLWVEHGYDQADAVKVLFEANGFKGVQTLYDIGHQPRVTGGYL